MLNSNELINKIKNYNKFVNLDRLNIFEKGTAVTPDLLLSRRVVRNLRKPIKILGKGSLSKSLDIKANMFSKSAIQKIQTAGGKAEILG